MVLPGGRASHPSKRKHFGGLGREYLQSFKQNRPGAVNELGCVPFETRQYEVLFRKSR